MRKLLPWQVPPWNPQRPSPTKSRQRSRWACSPCTQEPALAVDSIGVRLVPWGSVHAVQRTHNNAVQTSCGLRLKHCSYPGHQIHPTRSSANARRVWPCCAKINAHAALTHTAPPRLHTGRSLRCALFEVGNSAVLRCQSSVAICTDCTHSQLSLFTAQTALKHSLLMHMDRDRLQDVLTEARVSEGLRDLVLAFAFAFPNIADLQPFILSARDFWTANNIEDPESSAAAARLRKALAKCHRLSLRSEPPEPAASSGSPCMQPNQLASWAEHLPPKLTSERVSSLIEAFKSNYPGKLLDADTTPSSLVHEGLKPGQSLKWVPWQYRLSSRQYQERMEANPSGPLGVAAPEPGFFRRHARGLCGAPLGIQTVFRNALALCQAAHLSNLKAFDKKIANLCLTTIWFLTARSRDSQWRACKLLASGRCKSVRSRRRSSRQCGTRLLLPTTWRQETWMRRGSS